MHRYYRHACGGFWNVLESEEASAIESHRGVFLNA
jgi:hypothetical protein